MNTKSIIRFAFLMSLAFIGCRNNNNERVTYGKIKRETIALTPKVTGRILKLYIHEGQFVKPGDTLAILDVPEVSAKMAQAKGVVKA